MKNATTLKQINALTPDPIRAAVLAQMKGTHLPGRYYQNVSTNGRGVSLANYDRMTEQWKRGGASYVEDMTATKAVLYMKYKPDGTMYNSDERKAKENRKYFDAYDWQITKDEKRYCNELAAYMKLVNLIEKDPKFYDRWYTAAIFCNIGEVQSVARWYHTGVCTQKYRLETIDFIANGTKNTRIVSIDTPASFLYNGKHKPLRYKLDNSRIAQII